MISGGTFVTETNCLDRRVQENVSRWLREKHQVGYIDVINEARQERILAEDEPDYLVDSIFERVKTSVQKNHLSLVAIFAHEDCAGNSLNEETQLEQRQRAKKNLGWQLNIEVQLLLVDQNWRVHCC